MTETSIADISKVMGINGAALAIGIVHIQQFLSILSLAVAIGYTLWKWRADIQKSKHAHSPKPPAPVV